MKLTARIKRKNSPLAKLVRQMSSGRPMIFIDPMGDAALLRRAMAAARTAGRQADFVQLAPKASRSTYAGTIG